MKPVRMQIEIFVKICFRIVLYLGVFCFHRFDSFDIGAFFKNSIDVVCYIEKGYYYTSNFIILSKKKRSLSRIDVVQNKFIVRNILSRS